MDRHLFFEYLNSVTTFLKRDYEEKLVSIILFGSLVNRDERITNSTDVDLLVILRDSCTSKDFQQIKRTLIHLECCFLSSMSNHESIFIRRLQNATGMFCNFFICRFSDFQKRNFNKVFSVNSLMRAFLAPQNSVWLSLLRQHHIIWGENAFRRWQTIPMMTKHDIVCSFLMNWLLATGAIFLYPFYSQMPKFSMEAMKWSLFTWKNIHHLEEPLFEIVTRYITGASKIERRALRCFIEFRKKKEKNKYFSFLAWIFVFLLHRSLLRQS